MNDRLTGWLTRVKASLPLVFALALAAGIMSVLVYPACQNVENARLRQLCQTNLKKLALAMHEYHDKHKVLPLHAIHDKSGKPLLSWRVLILPYLDEQGLYEQFRLDEPWDSPHNKKLIDKMPEVYLHPARPAGEEPFTTHWQVFVGPGAAFEGQRGVRFGRDFPDGHSNTILIAEAARGVPWTKPEDLPYAPGQPLPRLGGHLAGGGFYVALADGSTRLVLPEVEEATRRAIITRNANDKPDPKWEF